MAGVGPQRQTSAGEIGAGVRLAQPVAFALSTAGAAASQNYSIQAQTVDRGGGQASSISYGMTSSLGNIGGSHSSAAAGVTLDSGYVAQIGRWRREC
jgi:hypothetical protein